MVASTSSSLISIEGHYPISNPITLSNNASTPLMMSVRVSNPNSQSYTVSWKRTYLYLIEHLTSSTNENTSFINFIPIHHMQELGEHHFTAEVRDGAGKIVTTKSFSVFLVDSPRPFIDPFHNDPLDEEIEYSPYDYPVSYKIRVMNNSANVSNKNYRAIWSLEMNGFVVIQETDYFKNISHSCFIVKLRLKYFTNVFTFILS
jgi:hypothetical protein